MNIQAIQLPSFFSDSGNMVHFLRRGTETGKCSGT